MTTPPPTTLGREEVARIIEPSLFLGWDYMVPPLVQRFEDALAKADTILSALSAQHEAEPLSPETEQIKYLNGTIPVRVVGSDYLTFLVERVDGKPLDDYGLRSRDWIAKGAIHDTPAGRSALNPDGDTDA